MLLPLWNNDQLPLSGQGWGHVLVVRMNHRAMFALWIEDTSFHWSLPFIFLEHFLKEMKNKEAVHFYLSLSYQIRSYTHVCLHFYILACTYSLLGHTCIFVNACVLSCTYTWMCKHPCTHLSCIFFNILDIVLHKCRPTVWAKMLAFQGENATFMDLIFSIIQFKVEFKENGEYFFKEVRIWNQESCFSFKSLREQSYLRIFRDFYSGFIIQKLLWKLWIETFID